MTLVLGLKIPAIEITAVIKRVIAQVLLCDLLRREYLRSGQFLDAHVAVIDLAAFGFQTEISLAWLDVVTARNLLAIHREFDGAIDGCHAEVIPFTRAVGATFARERTRGAIGGRAIWSHAGTMDGENITMTGPVCTFPAVDNLHFNCARKRHAPCGQGVSPNKETSVAAADHVLVFELRDEVAIHFFCTHHPGGLAVTENHVVGGNGERGICAIDIHPTAEIFAVEQIHKTILLRGRFGHTSGGEQDCAYCEKGKGGRDGQV